MEAVCCSMAAAVCSRLEAACSVRLDRSLVAAAISREATCTPLACTWTSATKDCTLSAAWLTSRAIWPMSSQRSRRKPVATSPVAACCAAWRICANGRVTWVSITPSATSKAATTAPPAPSQAGRLKPAKPNAAKLTTAAPINGRRTRQALGITCQALVHAIRPVRITRPL